MSTIVPLYGFGGGSGGTGAALTVNAPAGATVTVSKDGKSKTKVADIDGVAVFKGLSTGEWTVTITNGTDTSTDTVQLTADYETIITFFSATIHVTYPAGSTCTATDGVTTLTAPDTSGTWECVVPNAGTWTVSEDGLGISDTCEISTDGQEVSVDISKKWLIKAGVYNADIASLTSTTVSVVDGHAEIKQTENRHCYMHMYPVSLSGYKTIRVKIADGAPAMAFYGSEYAGCGFGVSTAKKTPSSTTKPLDIWDSTTRFTKNEYISGGTFSLDVSSLNGNYYFGFDFEGNKSLKQTLYIESAWLECAND